MPRRLTTQDISLKELFSAPNRFLIPHYQREYAWEREHASQLLDDILLSLDDAAASGALPAFLGTILVFRQTDGEGEPPGADAGRLEIVDGQQRLITLTMLLACLRDVLAVPEQRALDALIIAGDAPVLELRDADADYFHRAVHTPGATRKQLPTLDDRASLTHVNIRQNRAILRNAVLRMDAARRRSLAAHVLENCRFVLIQADDLDYSHQIFLAINERGKELTLEDIFQAEMLGPLDADQRVRYAPIIGHIGRYRREGQQAVARNKTFFTHYVFAHGWGKSSRVRAVRDDIRRSGGPAPFVRQKFIPFADAYLALSGQELPHVDLTPPARTAIEHLEMLEAHGDDDWMATAMLAMTRLPPASEHLGTVLAALDRFAHTLLAQGLGADKRRQRLEPVNTAILAREPWPEVAARLALPKRDMTAALRNMAQRLHIMDKATCRLVLIRIDAHLSGRPLMHYRYLPEYPLKTDVTFTVEHLLPKGRRIVSEADREWTALYPDARHREACAQYLGNLTLVRHGENKDLGQLAFLRKVERLLAAGPHPIDMNNHLAATPDWSLDALTARHRNMMDAAKAIWQLEGNYPLPPPIPSKVSGKTG